MQIPHAEIDEQLRQRAAAIRLCCFDVDGTLTDGRLWFNGDGEALKAFHVHDGQGLRLLEDHGIAVALITARDSAAARARADDLRLSSVFPGGKGKLSRPAHAGRERAQFVTAKNGGDGAARELCDLILEARGLKAAVLAKYTVG